MKIAIRGEGSTDVGIKSDGSFQKGPMLILLEKLDCYRTLLEKLGFSDGLNIEDFIEWEYIHKSDIKSSTNFRRRQVLRSKKEIGLNLKGFYKNSESFASIAREKDADIAIFFVDTDKEFSEDRHLQVNAGLSTHNYNETGVPMIPTKISEAWLMCCLSAYQNCSKHENATTDKSNPKHPKKVCDASGKTRYEIAQECDSNKIDMPSFNRFKEDFSNAVNHYIKYQICR
jgi:hypothetical protein